MVQKGQSDSAAKVFTGPGDDRLPSNVRDLSLEKRRTWVGAWNGRFKDCQDEGVSARHGESSAFAVANAAIKESLDPEEAAKFYNGFLEGWDMYPAQFNQEEVNYNSLGASSERGCANCRWFVAPSLCLIVMNYPDPITPNGISDRWEAKKVFEMEPLEVIIVGEQTAAVRDPSPDLTDKATKTEGGVEYPASDFAVVPDAEKPSGWKLRLAEDSAGNQTVAQVGRAITALQPGGFRGQRVQLTSEQKTSAISKIGGAIGRISGATADQKSNLRERLDGVKARTVQVTVPQRLVPAVKEKLTGLLSPAGEAPNSFVLFKEANGDIRWFAWATNKWRDRDNPPEIISDKAHLDYVAYVDQTGNYPEAWLWHTPGSRWGKADWLDYADGFLMVSGTVDHGKEYVADALALQGDLGVSHGFRYRHSDAEKGIIGWYRTFEVSPLPIEAAANPWTSMEVLQKELEMSFGTAKRAFLVNHLGETEVKRLEGDTEALKAALEKAGVEWKDVPDDGDSANPPTEASTEMKAMALEAGKAAAEALVALPAFKTMVEGQVALQTELKGLIGRIEALEKTEDEKIAAAVGARDLRGVGHVASQSGENIVGDKEAEALKAFQGPSILDEIMQGMEVTADAPAS